MSVPIFNMKQKRKQINTKKIIPKTSLKIAITKKKGNIRMEIKIEYKLTTG